MKKQEDIEKNTDILQDDYLVYLAKISEEWSIYYIFEDLNNSLQLCHHIFQDLRDIEIFQDILGSHSL
jgi:hypothetical protein